MDSWKVIYGSGLKEFNERFHDMVFVDDKTGFLFGTSTTYEIITSKRFDQQSAVVYKTVDGGYNWTVKELCKGEMTDAVAIENTLFAVSNRSSVDYYALVDTSIVFASYDQGESWQEVLRCPYFVRNIFFSDALTGYVITKKQNEPSANWRISTTEDGGRSWSELFQVRDIQKPLIHNGILYYLSQWTDEPGGIKKAFTSVDLTDTIRFKEKKLPEELDPYIFTIGGNNELLIAGTENGQAVIYQENREGSYTKLKVFTEEGVKPEHIYAFADKIMLITYQREGFGAKKRCFTSENNGKDWVEERLPISDYVQPVAFNKGNAWAYSGARRILVR